MSIIEVANLRKTYGSTVAVDDVSFHVEEGEIFGILGPNGAGKTTTVECIEGLRRPDDGTIRVLGLDPTRDRLELRLKVGAQLQESELPEKLSVREALELYASFYPDPADPQVLMTELGLAGKADTKFGKLSGGQRQRLSIALALIGNPSVAVLDELTTGLDPQARRDTWQLVENIRARGVTIVLVTHLMDEAQRLCDRLAVIDAGRVVAVDSPAGLVDRVSDEMRVAFRPSAPLDVSILADLPEVTEVSRNGEHVVVTGTGDLLYPLVTTLAAHDVAAVELRTEHANLEDAFVTLTGRSFDEEPTAA
ncbi:ABC-2 type transport system ATP-binding protein [Haloactinopolyspora alba]|uniref:ABC-2 type transport system ATP-binding protein n=1 Tax=Haloactinopolyspora alba TaxID=648780 RepID=A0A2P8E250_9ACTN|nr:ABC transporter ATP-binding protein [Haloactinopolyspora alba]PSL03554.1 ABC-2 type transport system ATP-binding protein [Haloactinopolyspora alba]